MKKLQTLDDETMAALDRLLSRPDLPEGSVTPWMLARFVAGDLGRAEAREVVDAVRGDPALAARLELLKADELAFEQAMPWEDVKGSIFERAERLPAQAAPSPRPAAHRWRLALFAAMGAAAALALALLVPPGSDPVQESIGSRYKTDETLQAFVLRDGRPERIQPGTALREGDLLQFRLSSPHAFLALVGVDGTGVVSRYEPVGGDVSAPFVPGNARPLADSLQLDDAPGPEVFLAFLSDEALLVEDLERSVHDVVTAGPEGVRALVHTDWAALGLAPQVAIFHVEKE